MKFRIPDGAVRWLGFAFIIGFGASFIFGSPRGRDLICGTSEACLATWIGALSGWAALVGALLTVGIMREQLAEQKRQTDYLVGNTEPEIHATGTVYADDQTWYPAIEITVINRNARPLEIKKISSSIDGKLTIGVRQVAHRGEIKHSYFPNSFQNTGIHRVLDGKEDGSAAERCVILCNIYREGKVFEIDGRDIESWVEYNYRVDLDCLLKGKNEEALVLSAYGRTDF